LHHSRYSQWAPHSWWSHHSQLKPKASFRTVRYLRRNSKALFRAARYLQFKPKALFRAASAWDSSGHGKRLSYWNPGDSSINSLLHGQLDVLRNRSRDVVRKNPFASNILDTIVANCIGTGIKSQPKIIDSALKKKLQNLWLNWTDEADFAEVTDFYGLQATILRAVAEAGECFIKFCISKANRTVPLQLQVLESEHLDSSKDYPLLNGNVIKSGIEFNKSGKRVAYHLFKEHPGDTCSELTCSGLDSVRVPVSEILHIYKALRPGQIRGEPWLARVLLKLYELAQYDDAELVRKKTAAMFAGATRRGADRYPLRINTTTIFTRLLSQQHWIIRKEIAIWINIWNKIM
jgi:lambda family phage portal protein